MRNKQLPLLLFAWACGAQCTRSVHAQSTGTNETALKYQEPMFLAGRIYSLDRKTLLFTFTREAKRSGEKVEAVRDYKNPDGKLVARELVEYHGDRLVSFSLQQTQTGAKGSARVVPATDSRTEERIAFEYSSDGSVKRDSEALRPDTLVNDMVGPFLLNHWEALMKGEAVRCRYIVIPRRETVGFTFVKQAETKLGTTPVVVVKMSATSPIIARLVEPLYFTIEKQAPHRVLEYSGRTTPKIRSGIKWEDFDGLTVFDWSK